MKKRKSKKELVSNKERISFAIVIYSSIMFLSFFYYATIKETPIYSPPEITVPKKQIKWEQAPLTMYNAGDVAQTDSNPCIGASGDNICELLDKGINVCAANFIPLYTKITIKELGNCIVLDRTNPKYKDRIDWALPFNQKQEALTWGKKIVNYIINE